MSDDTRATPVELLIGWEYLEPHRPNNGFTVPPREPGTMRFHRWGADCDTLAQWLDDYHGNLMWRINRYGHCGVEKRVGKTGEGWLTIGNAPTIYDALVQAVRWTANQ